MKKFFMVSPQQPADKLKACCYISEENDRLQYGETRFPIIPVIHGYLSPGEQSKIYLLMPDVDRAKSNKQTFLDELEALCVAVGLTAPLLVQLDVPFNNKTQTLVDLFAMLIEEIDDGDELYACFTYGTKPMPIVEMMALHFGYRAKKDVKIGCVVYGQLEHETGKSFIFDVTRLLYLDEIVNALALAGIKEPAAHIRTLLLQEMGDSQAPETDSDNP